MANRRFEMHEHRHVIHRMRLGESDRSIAKSGLMGRLKCAQLNINVGTPSTFKVLCRCRAL